MPAAKKKKEEKEYCCYICGRVIAGEKYEYIKTRRGTEIRIHEGCIPRGRKQV